jgi:uncharacterized membrane protein
MMVVVVMVMVVMGWRRMVVMMVVVVLVPFGTTRAERGSPAIGTVHVGDALLFLCSLWLLSLLRTYSSHHLATI